MLNNYLYDFLSHINSKDKKINSEIVVIIIFLSYITHLFYY